MIDEINEYDTWSKIYERHYQWVKDTIMMQMRLHCGEPVDWKTLDRLFIGIGLSKRQLPAVEMVIGDLCASGKIQRMPILRDENQNLIIRYELPVLERLASV